MRSPRWRSSSYDKTALLAGSDSVTTTMDSEFVVEPFARELGLPEDFINLEQ